MSPIVFLIIFGISPNHVADVFFDFSGKPRRTYFAVDITFWLST